MSANCAFGVRCANPKCGYRHWERIYQTDAPVKLRTKIAKLFEREVVTANKLRLFKTVDCRSTCCKYSLLCYERECKYRHAYNTYYELEENCRIDFKKLLEKFLKAWNKEENKDLSDTEFEIWLDDWLAKMDVQLVQAKLKKEIEEYRNGKQCVDWNDLV